jgi:hypothetical protein
MSSRAEELLASQNGFCSMESVGYEMRVQTMKWKCIVISGEV